MTTLNRFWQYIAKGRIIDKWKAQSRYRQRFLAGAFWSLIGTAAGQGLGLIANAIAARLLGPEKFGELGIIYSTVGMFGVLAGLGMGTTGVRYIAELREVDPQRSGRIIGLGYLVTLLFGGLVAALVFFFAPLLAQYTLAAPHLFRGLQIGALLLLLSALDGVQIGALAGFEAFASIAGTRAIYGLALLLALPLGVYTYGVNGGIVSMTVAVGISCLANSFMLRKQYAKYGISIDFLQSHRELKLLLGFSIPAALSGLLVSPVIWLSNTMMVNQPQGYVMLGSFQAAMQWQRVIMFLPTALSNVLLTLLSQRATQSSEKLAYFNILSSWVIGLTCAVPLLLLPELVYWIYGEQYSFSVFAPTLSLVMLFTIIVAYKDGLARVLVAKSLMWWGVLSNIVWGVLLISATFALREIGAQGLALAYVIAYGLNTIVFIPFYTKRGLVPKNVLISRQVIFIWGVLILASLSVGLGLPWTFRLLLLLLFLVVFYLLFDKLLREKQVV